MAIYIIQRRIKVNCLDHTDSLSECIFFHNILFHISHLLSLSTAPVFTIRSSHMIMNNSYDQKQTCLYNKDVKIIKLNNSNDLFLDKKLFIVMPPLLKAPNPFGLLAVLYLDLREHSE